MRYSALFKKTVAAALITLLFTPAFADTSQLPRRISPIPSTTSSVPHIQIGIVPDQQINAELLRQAALIPGVEVRPTVISLPGAKGFWINESVTIGNPGVIVGGREFAHMHPDGSLHASLSPETAVEAVKKGWATFHPWSTQREGWEGFVMIYTPTSEGELNVVMDIVRRGYDFVVSKP